MGQITINVAYRISDIVFLRTDPEQQERIVTGYSVARDNVLYELACGIAVTQHYDFEITYDKDITKI